MNYNKHQEFEKNWWGNCCNSFGEEYKQLAYAKRMGLSFFHNGKSPYNIDMQCKSVIDIGGGPTSLLLKSINVTGTVVDPCCYPQWVYDRYDVSEIQVSKIKGEDIDTALIFDEAWIYNVLQHTENPELVVKNARSISRIIRLFEWVDCGTSLGHPHELTPSKLNEWLNGEGKIDFINENMAKGKCYFGIFKGEHFEQI